MANDSQDLVFDNSFSAAAAGGYGVMPRGQIMEAGLNPTALAVYAVLASHADKDIGRCWPSTTTIAGAIGRGRRVVQRALNELEGKGLITRDDRHGRSNIFHVTRDVDQTEAIAAHNAGVMAKRRQRYAARGRKGIAAKRELQRLHAEVDSLKKHIVECSLPASSTTPTCVVHDTPPASYTTPTCVVHDAQNKNKEIKQGKETREHGAPPCGDARESTPDAESISLREGDSSAIDVPVASKAVRQESGDGTDTDASTESPNQAEPTQEHLRWPPHPLPGGRGPLTAHKVRQLWAEAEGTLSPARFEALNTAVSRRLADRADTVLDPLAYQAVLLAKVLDGGDVLADGTVAERAVA